MNEIAINTTNGNYTVSSLQIAESFEKQHKNVIRDIEKIIAECVENRSAQNCADLFIASTYADSYGRTQKCYEVTRDGFALLAMGFTGKTALEWKLKYIAAFNKMEQHIKAQQTQLNALEVQAKADRAAAMKMNAENRRLKMILNNPPWQKEHKEKDFSLTAVLQKAEELLDEDTENYRLAPEERLFTAAEIGRALRASAMDVGKKANQLGMKTEEYGKFELDGNKEHRVFRYNIKGFCELAKAFGYKKIYFK